MSLVWNPFALPQFVAGAIALAAAALVVNVGGGRPANRLLATILTLYSVGYFAIGALYSDNDPHEVIALQVVGIIPFFMVAALYPAFLGAALSRAPRFLRARWWLVASAGVGLLLGALCIVRTDLLVIGTIRPTYAPYELVPGPLFIAYFLLTLGGSLLGLVLSLRELVSVPRGTPARRRAGWFLLAFGLQDALLPFQSAIVAAAPADSWLFVFVNMAGYPIAGTATSLLVVYGIVKYQLFDIDVKIKLGVKRTTVAGAFLATTFVVAQLVQAFAGLAFGAIAGAVAAGLLLFALAPLQRMAERISDAAMPRVHNTAEYRTVRKREVYLAAVESAMEDGNITERERSVLATLADQLGLGAKETLQIEREARIAVGGAGAT